MKFSLLALLFLSGAALAAESTPDLAIAKGVAFLLPKQQADGSIANPANAVPAQDYPALTALPLIALQRSGQAPAEMLRKGYAYLRTKAKPDGSIYEKGLANYNTSVCLMALLQSGDPADEALLAKARAYVVGQQAHDLPKPETEGGFGYGTTGGNPKRGHPDLDNTLVALQALAAYREARPTAEHAKSDDLNWQAAIDFISRCQNLPQTNPLPWASDDPANKGGAIYYPGFSNAGEQDLPDGKKAFRSYGTASYAALLSFIYADLPKSDPRIMAALDWLSRNYTLEENPGMGHMGLYYYYHLAIRGLAAAGVAELATADGRKVDWKRDLTQKILALQAPDGSWVNDNARWMETDPVLVTTYCLLSLETLSGK